MRQNRPALSVAELSLLFTGDELTEAFPHVNLVIEICDQVWPTSAFQLMCVVFGVPEEGPETAELAGTVDEHTWRTIDGGFRAWCAREQQRAA
jgi:hypothetical protein